MTHLTSNSSKPVQSSQAGVHPKLAEVLQRHVAEPWQLKLHQPSKAAFHKLRVLVEAEAERPLILDSGCGTGKSTVTIAQEYPECLVLGIDQSAKRLERTGGRNFPYRVGNVIWVRAELASFWWLARAAGWKLQQHYILYPNPWPKAAQLRRRWHGHPVFPTLLALGGVLELRCNWEIYAQEFAAAVSDLTGISTAVKDLRENVVTTPFETKYRNSGMPLFQVRVDLEADLEPDQGADR